MGGGAACKHPPHLDKPHASSLVQAEQNDCLTIDQEAVPMQYVLSVKRTQLYVRQDSSFGVMNGLPTGQLRNSGLFPGRDKRFTLLQKVQTGCGAHPASCTMHNSFSGIMWLGYAADHLAPVEVKHPYSWTPSFPHVIIMFTGTPFFAVHTVT